MALFSITTQNIFTIVHTVHVETREVDPACLRISWSPENIFSIVHSVHVETREVDPAWLRISWSLKIGNDLFWTAPTVVFVIVAEI